MFWPPARLEHARAKHTTITHISSHALPRSASTWPRRIAFTLLKTRNQLIEMELLAREVVPRVAHLTPR